MSANILDFGADPTGATDSAPAINSAIASISPYGDDVIFPAGIYSIASTIVIGNGSPTAISSRYGVHLKGVGSPTMPYPLNDFGTSSAVKLKWTGPANGTMIDIQGPLQGWGLHNLFLDGNSVAAIGVNVLSAQFGQSDNLSVANCGNAAICTTTHPSWSGRVSSTINSMHNSYRNTQIYVPSISFAKGIFIGGQASNANTCYDIYQNNTIILTADNVGVIGIWLQRCDSNQFIGTHIVNGNPQASFVLLDYSSLSGFPSANAFFAIDVGSTGHIPWYVIGSPPSGLAPNLVYALLGANGSQPTPVPGVKFV